MLKSVFGLFCANLFAVQLVVTNNLPDNYGYSVITPQESQAGSIPAGSSKVFELGKYGGAWYHGQQVDFAFFPKLERYKINACCSYGEYYIKYMNELACGLGYMDFPDKLEISIEPC